MAALNPFRKKEEKEKTGGVTLAEPVVKEEKGQREVRFSSLGVLRFPHVTEKAGALAQRGVYVFRLFPGATKGQVKEAVEKAYGVKVVGVRTIKIPSKSIRMGKTKGVKKGYRKALVELAKGQEIEIMPR